MPIVTLLTDFGTTDPYVGELKAALHGAVPEVRWVDLTHGIAPGDVRGGAWILRAARERFPAGTVHLAVVDPGVGGDRRPLAARAGGHLFVGPDNGLLEPVLRTPAAEREIREITLRELDTPRRGTTFDGRDVFAPVAARLAAGLDLREIGPEVHDPVPAPVFAPRPAGPHWELEVVRCDRYGNLVTICEEAFLRETFADAWRDIAVRVGDRRVEGIRLSYDAVAEGELVLTIGSAGTLEVSCRLGNAVEVTGLGAGAHVLLEGLSPAEDPA